MTADHARKQRIRVLASKFALSYMEAQKLITEIETPVIFTPTINDRIPKPVALPTVGPWHQLPLGTGARPVTHDVLTQPHLLIHGASGGGKSTAASVLIEGAEQRGWEIIICDRHSDLYDANDGRVWREPPIMALIDVLRKIDHSIEGSVAAAPTLMIFGELILRYRRTFANDVSNEYAKIEHELLRQILERGPKAKVYVVEIRHGFTIHENKFPRQLMMGVSKEDFIRLENGLNKEGETLPGRGMLVENESREYLTTYYSNIMI